MVGTATKVSAGVGGVSLTGSGGGTGTFEDGVVVGSLDGYHGGSLVSATGSGNVTIHGTGSSSGTSYNVGSYFFSPGTSVNTVDGSVTITGSGGGSGYNNDGVWIADYPRVQATGQGAVTILGTGSSTGVEGSDGVVLGLYNTSATVTTVSGALTIIGTHGSGIDSNGVNIGFSGIQVSTSGGPRTITSD